MAWLTVDRRKSLGGGVTGLVVAALLIAALSRLLPIPSRETAIAAAFLAPGVIVFLLTLAVSAGRLLGHRFDPLSDPDSRYIAVSQRSLTNSVEQGLVFAMAAGTLAWTADPVWRAAVLALSVSFVLGRIAFWLGYLRGTFGRAPGMGATMVTNLIAVMLAVYHGFSG